jgi:Zn-dependent protease
LGGDVAGFLFRAVAVLAAIIVHEYAHGWMADAQGDPTPRASGRLTLNPLAHLDPIGTLMLLFFRFGWAKPVPVNPAYFRDRRNGMIRVAVAGPAANLITALLAMSLAKAGGRFLGTLGSELLSWVMLYNVWFALFNLLPVPPLDGSRIVRPYLRGQAARLYWQYEQHGWVVMVLAVATGVVSAILGPVASLVIRLMDWMTFFLKL